MIEVDYNAVVADRPTDQKLKPARLAAMSPPPLPRRRPPLRPRKPAELAAGATAAAAAAAGSANGSSTVIKHDDSSQSFPPQKTEMHHHQIQDTTTDSMLLRLEEEELEQLAKLMLSPEGLAAKKITLEGFAVPVSLRLLDRHQQQRHHAVESSRLKESAPALSITWIELDTVGFDIAGLTSIRRAKVSERRSSYAHGTGAAGRKRSWGGASRDAQGEEPLVLVLSWGVEGAAAGPAEVAFELATPQERDHVATMLEMLVAGLASDEAPPQQQQEASEQELTSGLEHAPNYAVELALQAATTATDKNATASASVGNDTRKEDNSGDSPTSPPPGFPTDSPSIPLGAGTAPSRGLSRLSSCSDTAITASRDVRDNASSRPGIIRRRGVSFGRAPREAAAVISVPPLTRSWTSGAVMGRRDSELEVLQPEKEEQSRRRRQDAMARLLAMYDRTQDEARAASWRLGAMKLKRLLSAAATRQTEKCWSRWCGAVRRTNEGKQKADRRMWYLHAKANQNNDLLAWYHATFCREVYRRRVPFWYRETQLRPYQKSYRIVDDGDNSYTGWEKSIMSSCVCTVGTKYADVAAQLFTAKDVLTPEEYRLFLALVKRGAEVPKAASKSGRKFPHPMKLRLWFNRGSLCLTAKRHKPDSASSKDHSFYLSKIKTCVVALPTAAAGGAGSGRKGSGGSGRKRHSNSSSSVDLFAPDSLGSSNSNSSSYGGVESFGLSSFTAPSPSDANNAAVVDVEGYDRRRSLSTPTSAVPATGFALPSPLHSPVPPLHLHDAVSGGGNRHLGGVPHDEADRGAGGRSGDIQGYGGSSSEGVVDSQRQESEGRSSMSPPAAMDGRKGVGMGGAEGSSSRRHQRRHQQQQYPHQRVLSIHFFGRSITLDLWFASEEEAVEWQGMLTKLSWKEQGYLYRGSTPSQNNVENEEDEQEERPGGASHETEMGAAPPGEDAETERERVAACRRAGESGSGSGSRDGGDEAGVSLGLAPSPSSSCSSLVATEWAHATHGRPPPPPPQVPTALR